MKFLFCTSGRLSCESERSDEISQQLESCMATRLERKLILLHCFLLCCCRLRIVQNRFAENQLAFSGKLTGKKLITKALMLKNYLFILSSHCFLYCCFIPQKKRKVWKNHRHHRGVCEKRENGGGSMMETHLENGKIHCVVYCVLSGCTHSLHMNKLTLTGSHENDL